MGYLILGFLLGLGAGWFLQNRGVDGRGFSRLVEKELAINGKLGSMSLLKHNLARVEERLATLEQVLVPHVQGQKELAGDSLPQGPPTLLPPDGERAQPLLVSTGGRNEERTESAGERRKKRSRVLVLWYGGSEVDDIARQTGLTRGEVELIIALQEGEKVARGATGEVIHTP